MLRFAEIDEVSPRQYTLNALDPEVLLLLGEYCRLRLGAGHFRAESGGSSAIYADPLGETLLDLATPHVSELVGVEAFPLNSFVRMYRCGGALAMHHDRDGCDWTMSVAIDREVGTPIWLLACEGGSAVSLKLGQAVMFCGRKVPHGRLGPAPGWSLWLFLHWTTDPRLAFDGRPGLGLSAGSRQ